MLADRRLGQQRGELLDLLVVEALHFPRMRVGIPEGDRDANPRVRVREQHSALETSLLPGHGHYLVPVDTHHLLRVYRSDPKVNHHDVHLQTPSRSPMILIPVYQVNYILAVSISACQPVSYVV